MPRWTDYCDWSRDLIVCGDTETATDIERVVSRWPAANRIAVATIAEPGPAPVSDKPVENIWLLVRSQTSAESGLPLCREGTNVRGKSIGSGMDAEHLSRESICDPNLPSCLETVARNLVDDERPIHALLSTTLANRNISPAVGKELIARVASLTGGDEASLVALMDDDSNPYALHLSTGTYTCREGRFWKKGKRGDFTPISNFSARVLTTRPYRTGNPMLDVEVSIGAEVVVVATSEAAFRNAQRLWKTIRTAGQKSGLPYPAISTVSDRKLLPQIIRGTCGFKP